ncbi:hypothetical protein FQA39_LY05438 [Lamprigera yunnana]|nr:hypothetical protein FQA39_LY05438 [Lamprigera yunnana]
MNTTMFTKAQDINEKARTKDVLIDSNCSFDSLLLSSAVLHGLQDANYLKPSPIQFKGIPLGKCGLDMIVNAKSGTGKTLVFTIIALEMINVDINTLQVLILAPTREIAIQIVDTIETLGKHINSLNVGLFIGGLSFTKDKKKAVNCHIAVGAPGRIKHLVETSHLNLKSVKLFVLDEADKLMCTDFQSDINYFYEMLPVEKQFLAVSATMTEELNSFLERYMNSPTLVTPETESVVLLGLRQFALVLDGTGNVVKYFNAKIEALLRLFSQISFTQCLVFSNYQRRAESISNILNQGGWKCTSITGAHSQEARLKVISDLKNMQCKILISTDLTARGIDASNVDLVINCDIPSDSATYLHRIGRTGRYGSAGLCITIVFGEAELLKLQHILGNIGGNELCVAQIPNGEITEDLWNCNINMFEQIHGIVDTKKEIANFDLQNSEIKTKDKNFDLQNSEIKTKDKNVEGKKHKNLQQILSVKECNDKSISTIYSDISSEDLLQSLALGNAPKTLLQPDKASAEELIDPASLYPWIPIEESVLSKPPGLNLLDDSDMCSTVDQVVNEDDKSLVLLKNVALYHVSKILKTDDWDKNVIEEARNPIKSYLTAVKGEEKKVYKKLYESTQDVDNIDLCTHIVDYSRKFSDHFSSPSNEENVCKVAYECITLGGRDWKGMVKQEPEQEMEQTVMDVEDEPDDYCGSYDASTEEQYDYADSQDQIFKSYFDYYDQVLANTALTFEDVPSFNKWFPQWKSQVKSLTKFVQQKIYLNEMNKYEQEQNNYI